MDNSNENEKKQDSVLDEKEIHDLKFFQDEFDDFTSTTYLYKKSQVTRKFAQVISEDDWFPSKDEIGKKFGSGSYKISLRGTDINGKARSIDRQFALHEHYDSYIKKEAVATQHNLNGAEIVSTIKESFSSFNNSIMNLGMEAMKFLVPIIMKKSNEKPESFGNFSEIFSNMLSKNMENMMDMQQNFQTKIMDMSVPTQEPSKSGLVELLEALKPVMEFLPNLLKMPKPVRAKMANQFITDEMKETLHDPENMQAVRNQLAENLGREAANKLVESFEEVIDE